MVIAKVLCVKKQTPGRVTDRGFKNSLAATRNLGRLWGNQARPWLNQYP